MPDAHVVSAHPEPHSFTAAWARASVAAVRALGGVAEHSDLYALGFDPAERAALYANADIAEGHFDPLKVQQRAVARDALPADLAEQVARIRRAGLLILHFPIWWFSPPAILKGWMDRALVHGALHAEDARFDRGVCRGKRALICVSTGCSAAECGPDGREGDLRLLLWPLAQTLRYCGFEVYEPVAVHSVHGYHEPPQRRALEQRLSETLAAQEGLVAGLETRPLWPFNRDADFDSEGRLLPEAPSHSPFIRHI
ncbi:NAD(P)H-dependent oxidoreductase [Tropicimonas sediminicola]|uniref:NAD(P)H dehydrogenase (Quinone) n=1 Tax=Tropicimonas sediminicola TaxID=1031541 RepID=A0A239LVX7_9RHOB|nr:NAD(P)H-dependent oxidoreductase [Tropicimonas sediminicola]SNT33774.1 NAD(P)H dehydrogenase (quinone) [Tropicimonas sediminicola]